MDTINKISDNEIEIVKEVRKKINKAMLLQQKALYEQSLNSINELLKNFDVTP